MNGQDKAKLIYIGDPMCSWCYGFSAELSEAMAALENEVDFEILLGGLRPYNTQTMTDLKDFLSEHWDDVAAASGQKFNKAILDTSLFYDTEPSCRAVLVVRSMHPVLVFDYFKKVQKAFYFQNKNPNIVETFSEIAAEMGIDKAKFENLYQSQAMQDAIKRDFARSEALGVRSFPSLVLQIGEDYYLIANGYTKVALITKKVRQLLLK